MRNYFKEAIINKFNVFNLARFDESKFGESGSREFRALQVKSVYSLTSGMMLGNIVFAALLTINLVGQKPWLDFDHQQYSLRYGVLRLSFFTASLME